MIPTPGTLGHVVAYPTVLTVVAASNHELFVLHKTQGSWKLARYSFSSVLPAA